MDPSLAGLIGALTGALAGIAGIITTHLLQAHRTQKAWLQTKREEAYAHAIKYLLHTLNKRTDITAEGVSIIDKEGIKAFFNNMVEAQWWLMQLTIYCSNSQKRTLSTAFENYSSAVSDVASGTAFRNELNISSSRISDDTSFFSIMKHTYHIVLECARIDLRQTRP